MIGLDTKRLVRYLTQDDPIQSLKATEILERRLTEETPASSAFVADSRTVGGSGPCLNSLAAQKFAAAVGGMLHPRACENEQQVFNGHDRIKEGQARSPMPFIAASRRKGGLFVHPDI